MSANHNLYIILLSIVTGLSACHRGTDYPTELVLADSAFMQGKPERGNHLIAAYEDGAFNETKEIGKYHQLLNIEKMYMDGELPMQEMDKVEALKRFYQNHGSRLEFAKTLLFESAILESIDEYPSAIESLLKAKSIAEQFKDDRLLALIVRDLGELYFNQRSLKECIPYYKEYYRLAVAHKDTLRMALASHLMGRVYSITSQVDSIVFYYQQAIELGQRLPQRDKLVPASMHNLCDIYIQTEQFDKALEVMPRNELNDGNWAYWHLGQEHTDSAIYYFQKLLGRYKWQGEVEELDVLARLERQRGNLSAALDYYERLSAAQDSMYAQQKQEETKRTQARYNFDSMKAQRDRLEQENRQQQLFIGLLATALFLAGAVAWMARRYYRHKQQADRQQLQLLAREKEEQAEQGRRQQAENSRKLSALSQELAEARRQNDAQAAHRIELETNMLALENQRIEATQQRRDALLADLQQTEVYQRLKLPSQQPLRISDEEWADLSQRLDDIYDHLSQRLLALARLSETELRICYLLKLHVAPADMADILFKTKAAITQARKRMYYKFTNIRGTAEQLDELIMEL
ncbi:MAG: hypothetical protein IJ243_09380 [Prevotella sp.]|nr:hypothetical protein [Prevotella sp.]